MDIFRSDKVFRHCQFTSWLSGANPYPITMEIDPCGACNSHCPKCVGGERHGLLPTERIISLLHEFAANGVRGIIYTGGGEPTLHPDLARIIRMTAAFGMQSAVITNGLKIGDELAETIVRHCAWCRVSLDAGTAAGYARSHGDGPEAFEAVQDSIGRLASISNRAATIGVGMLVDDSYFPEMRSATRIARERGADYIQFRPYYLAPWFGGPRSMDIAEFRRKLSECEGDATDGFSVLHSAGKFERMEHNDYGRNYDTCWGQQFCGVVTATGDVALCCLHRGSKAHNLGNIMESSFSDVWNGERRQSVLAALDVERQCPPLCRCDGINERIEGMLASAPAHVEFL